jgi:hypothetical protein
MLRPMDLRTRSGESAANGFHARESEPWTDTPNGFGLVLCWCGLLVVLNKGTVDNSEMRGVEISDQRNYVSTVICLPSYPRMLAISIAESAT